jgi:hypothetical protein
MNANVVVDSKGLDTPLAIIGREPERNGVRHAFGRPLDLLE